MDTGSRNRRYGAAALITAAALGVLGASDARAQAQQPPRSASAAPGNFYAFGGLAAFAADDSTQLTRERSGAALIAGGGFRATPNFAVEVDLLGSLRSSDTPTTAQPPAGTYAAGTLKSGIGTAGIGATLKFILPSDRLEPYFGGGAGAYSTKFRTTSEAIGCSQNCRDTGPRVDASSRDIGIHALAGADYRITPNNVVGGEIRYLRLKADLGAIVPGQVNAGGLFVWLGYRRYF